MATAIAAIETCTKCQAKGAGMNHCDHCDTKLCAICDDSGDGITTLATCQVCESSLCDRCLLRCSHCSNAVCENDTVFLLQCDGAGCSLHVCLVCVMGKQACSGCGAVPGKAQRKQAKRGLEVGSIAKNLDFRFHYMHAHSQHILQCCGDLAL
jgi:hypothetical protein